MPNRCYTLRNGEPVAHAALGTAASVAGSLKASEVGEPTPTLTALRNTLEPPRPSGRYPSRKDRAYKKTEAVFLPRIQKN